MIIRNEKYKEVPKGVYSVTIKPKHIVMGSYDFYAYKIKTIRGKYIDFKFDHLNSNFYDILNNEDFENYIIGEKEFKIYVTKDMLEYTVNDKGFYICKLIDYVSIEYD